MKNPKFKINVLKFNFKLKIKNKKNNNEILLFNN